MDGKLPRFLRNRKLTAAVSLTAAAGMASLIFLLWLHGAFLPRWIEWDKNAPDIIPEGVKYKLSDEWLIQDALIFDIDGCGKDETVILLWKRGSYGSKRPTWVKRDETGFSQHIFIYKEKEDGWHPIWMSSKLHFEAAGFMEGAEIPGTGRPSLDTVAPDGSRTRWGWLSWGLVEVD